MYICCISSAMILPSSDKSSLGKLTVVKAHSYQKLDVMHAIIIHFHSLSVHNCIYIYMHICILDNMHIDAVNSVLKDSFFSDCISRCMLVL